MSNTAESSETPQQPPNIGTKTDAADSQATAEAHDENKQPSTDPPDGWTKNITIKTCVCEICGDKVNGGKESHQCTICLRHICSQCQKKDKAKCEWHHAVAMDHLNNGCWCKKWRSNMNPAFASTKPRTDPRPEEEQRAKTAKGKATATHAAKAGGQMKGTNKAKEERESSSQASVEDSNIAASREDDDSDATISMPSTPMQTRKRIIIEDSDDSSDEVGTTQKKTRVNGKLQSLQINPPEPIKALQTPQHLQNGHTVIVGAGMVGLFVARELALARKETGMNHQITVVEIRSGPCDLASGHCNGILTTVEMPEAWGSVSQVAEEAWFDMLESSGFRSEVNFSPSTLLCAAKGEGTGDVKPPSWFTKEDGISLERDSDAIGRIDAEKLAMWLYQQCQDLGIHFEFNRLVWSPKFSMDSQLQYVDLNSAEHAEGWEIQIPCTNLVLTAGPFTTGYLSRLFENVAPIVENRIQAADWIRITPPKDTTENINLAIRLPEAAQPEKRWRDEIVMLSSATNPGLVVSAYSARWRNRDNDIDIARKSKKCNAAELLSLAKPYLDSKLAERLDDESIEAEGRYEVSTGYDDSPVIDKVPPSSLGLPIKDDADDMHPCGIWLCYGFGRYGTLLAPGGAKMLVDRMFGRGADELEYRLPVDETRTAREEAKAKSRTEDTSMEDTVPVPSAS